MPDIVRYTRLELKRITFFKMVGSGIVVFDTVYVEIILEIER